MLRFVLPLLILLVSCGTYDPTPQTSLSQISGRWTDSTEVSDSSLTRTKVDYTFSIDSVEITKRQYIENVAITPVVQSGIILPESTYVDISKRQVFSVLFHEPVLDTTFVTIFRIDSLMTDTLILASIKHDSQAYVPNSGVTFYNETATVLESKQLVRVK